MAGEAMPATFAVEPPPDSAHPPALPGLPTVDGSYRSLLGSLPAELRETASRLPWRLGLTRSPAGGWGDFVGLHPNRELPLYAAEDGDGELAVPRVELRRFLHAHHLGGFCWLLRDRIEDGQVDDDPRLRALGAIFEDRWREALAGAMGDGTLAEALCDRAAARWQRGTRAEHRLLAARSMRAPIYASVVKEKLSWIAVPSQALLMKRGTARRVTAFLRAHELFMLGLQAIDDVIDTKQDEVLRGGDVPTALGCSAGALMRVAPKLVQRAAEVATEGRFGWFARWLEAFARAIAGWRLAGDALVDELDAIGIAGEIEEEVLGGDRLVQVPAGAPAVAAPG
jgi:hypothetical protein